MNDKEYLDKVFDKLKNSSAYKEMKESSETADELLNAVYSKPYIEDAAMKVMADDYPEAYKQYEELDKMPDSEEKRMKEEELDKKWFNPMMYQEIDKMIKNDF